MPVPYQGLQSISHFFAHLVRSPRCYLYSGPTEHSTGCPSGSALSGPECNLRLPLWPCCWLRLCPLGFWWFTYHLLLFQILLIPFAQWSQAFLAPSAISSGPQRAAPLDFSLVMLMLSLRQHITRCTGSRVFFKPPYGAVLGSGTLPKVWHFSPTPSYGQKDPSVALGVTWVRHTSAAVINDLRVWATCCFVFQPRLCLILHVLFHLTMDHAEPPNLTSLGFWFKPMSEGGIGHILVVLW